MRVRLDCCPKLCNIMILTWVDSHERYSPLRPLQRCRYRENVKNVHDMVMYDPKLIIGQKTEVPGTPSMRRILMHFLARKSCKDIRCGECWQLNRKRVTISLKLLTTTQEDREHFSQQVFTEDKILLHHLDPETKQQSKQ